MVRTILSTFFTYFLSSAQTFRVPKLLAVVATDGIGDISVNSHYHVPNFKVSWGLRGIEAKNVGVGVNKLVIFCYCNPFYFKHLLFFQVAFDFFDGAGK